MRRISARFSSLVRLAHRERAAFSCIERMIALTISGVTPLMSFMDALYGNGYDSARNNLRFIFSHITSAFMNEYDLGYIARLERERVEWIRRHQELNEMLKKMTTMVALFALLAAWSIGCLIYTRISQ